MSVVWSLSPDRCFDPQPEVRAIARALYAAVRETSIVSPHGHVDPALLADPLARFGTPAELLIIPDHYVFRLIHSRGIPLEQLGVPSLDGTPVETDHRRIWRVFAEHFPLFAGTPSGLWLSDVLINLFGLREKPSSENADRLYDELAEKLAAAEFTPRALYTRFRIAQIATSDAATSELREHRSLQAEGWSGRMRPTFRPDAVVNLDTPAWREGIERLGALTGIDVHDYRSYLRALESRRAVFKDLGATATDHAALTPHTERLSLHSADAIFQRALRGETVGDDAARFTAHMLMEMARMSRDDGLVMQLHAGSYRNHDEQAYRRFGADKGADIPVRLEWTQALRPLLNEFGSDPAFRLIVFGLDESTYSRELAPLAGHYPALLLGPPWWFHDSVHGMRRFLDSVVETAGWENLAGFNDDTRAFCSIPARHDVWRRVSCDWLAAQVARGLIARDDAERMAREAAADLALRAYRLG